MAEISKGDRYKSLNEFKEVLKNFEISNNINTTIIDSKTLNSKIKSLSSKNMKEFNMQLHYYYVVYTCTRSGKYRPNATKGVRPNQHTAKTGCPWRLRLAVTECGGYLEVTEFNSCHNHEVNSEIFKLHIKQRKLDAEEVETVVKMSQVKASRRLIKQHIEETSGKTLKMKDINNTIAASKLKAKCSENEADDLLEKIKNIPNLDFKLFHDSSNTVTAIYLQDKEMKSNFKAFPEVLLCDATYKVSVTNH